MNNVVFMLTAGSQRSRQGRRRRCRRVNRIKCGVEGCRGSVTPLARSELILYGTPLHLEPLMESDDLNCQGMMVWDAAKAWCCSPGGWRWTFGGA